MKHYYKFSFLALIFIAFVYSACVKSMGPLNDSNKSTVSTQQVSSQVVLNLKEILYGEYGSFSIADGASAPTNMDVKHKGKLKVQSEGSDDCGFKIDTAYNITLDLSDTAKFDIWNKIKYEVICTGGKFAGSNVYDSLNVVINSSDYTVQTKSSETLSLQLLTPGNEQSQFNMNGSMNVYAFIQPHKTNEKNTTASYNYNFTSLVIDPTNNGDIKSGSATFATKGNTDNGIWDYKGTIQFLGGHLVSITINNNTYTYNLQTGMAV